MKPRHKRFALIGGALAVLGIAAALVLNAFQSNLVFFFTPTQIAAGEAPKGKTFRISNMGDETEETIGTVIAALDDSLAKL